MSKPITTWNSTFDIIVQAGHENTPDNMTGGESEWGKEINWTPIVANEAVRILNAAGVSAKKIDASIKSGNTGWECRLAVFMHFDDPDDGSSGPSVGYPTGNGNEPAVNDWKTLYKKYWPFPGTWHSDNFTNDESGYYGYRYTRTTDAEMLIELGDLSNKEQALWMRPRLKWMGALLAHFLSKRSGLGNVPDPGPYQLNQLELGEVLIVTPSGGKPKAGGGSAASGAAAGHYKMPAYAVPEFGPAGGLPWGAALPLPKLNWYSGIVSDSAFQFPGNIKAIYYESKFAIDADGSSGDAQDDPDGQTDTSLHTSDGVALNSRTYPFIVLPLEPSQTSASRQTIQGLGAQLGDLGVVIYKTGKVIPVVYGDKGPATKLGEGSMGVAKALGMSSSPTTGGINANEVPPGVVHLVFPGTSDEKNGVTKRTPKDIAKDALALFDKIRV
jgi:hypothetical protein